MTQDVVSNSQSGQRSVRKYPSPLGMFILAACVVLAGVAAWWFNVGQLQHQAKVAIAREMKDPDSVQFRNVRVVHLGSLKNVCGEVNAKNSYGAYIGFSQFIYYPPSYPTSSGKPHPGTASIGPGPGEDAPPFWRALSGPCEPWPQN
jgi:hypothetical protein